MSNLSLRISGRNNCSKNLLLNQYPYVARPRQQLLTSAAAATIETGRGDLPGLDHCLDWTSYVSAYLLHKCVQPQSRFNACRDVCWQSKSRAGIFCISEEITKCHVSLGLILARQSVFRCAQGFLSLRSRLNCAENVVYWLFLYHIQRRSPFSFRTVDT